MVCRCYVAYPHKRNINTISPARSLLVVRNGLPSRPPPSPVWWYLDELCKEDQMSYKIISKEATYSKYFMRQESGQQQVQLLFDMTTQHPQHPLRL
jgi:hypothetical protein